MLITTCPKTSNKNESYINSPNYPETYDSGTDCIWTFKLQPKQKLVLKFVDFDVDWEQYDCYDYVKISWTTKGKREQTKTFCNKKKHLVWDPIEPYGDEVKVSFHSNWRYQYKGFKMEYELFDIGKKN